MQLHCKISIGYEPDAPVTQIKKLSISFLSGSVIISRANIKLDYLEKAQKDSL